MAAITAGASAVKAIKDLTGGGAGVSVDALGSSQTIVPGVQSLRKGGRHLQLGKTGQEERGMVALPVDAMVLQELTFVGSLGCPVTSYPGLLSMIATGRLNPKQLVTHTVAIEGVNDVLQAMTHYRTQGFNMNSTW